MRLCLFISFQHRSDAGPHLHIKRCFFKARQSGALAFSCVSCPRVHVIPAPLLSPHNHHGRQSTCASHGHAAVHPRRPQGAGARRSAPEATGAEKHFVWSALQCDRVFFSSLTSLSHSPLPLSLPRSLHLQRAIPAHCFERDTLKSLYYVAHDLFFAAVLYAASQYIDSPALPAWAPYLLWPLYWWCQVCRSPGSASMRLCTTRCLSHTRSLCGWEGGKGRQERERERERKRERGREFARDAIPSFSFLSLLLPLSRMTLAALRCAP